MPGVSIFPQGKTVETPAPFLFVSARPDDVPRAGELASVRGATGLDESSLVSHRVDVDPLPPSLFERKFAGVIVGGSPFMVTDPDIRKSAAERQTESELARLAEFSLSTGLPVFFTCYGIGVVGRVLGGGVDLDHPEEAGAVWVDRVDAAVTDPLTAELPERFLAVTGHKESVPVLPPGATLLATRPECPVQLFRAGDALYASQFHPEPTGHDFAERAKHYQEHGYFPPEELARVQRALSHADVVEPRRLLRRFVELFAVAA